MKRDIVEREIDLTLEKQWRCVELSQFQLKELESGSTSMINDR